MTLDLRFQSRLWLVLLLQAAGYAGAAQVAPVIVHDPFSRPVLAVTPPKVAPPIAASELPPQWDPTLIAVMSAGTRSIVNVDGTIVGIGQEIDGYRLLSVGYREAIFAKGKQRLVLKMDAPVSQPKMDRAVK